MNKITFCTYDAPLFFGPNTSLRRLLPGLRANGFDIEVLVFYEGSLTECETYKYFVDHGVAVKTFPYLSDAEQKIGWILSTLVKAPPAVFVSYLVIHSLYAARWLKEAGIPTVGCIHSDDKFYKGVMNVFVKGQREYQVTAVVSCSDYLDKQIANLNTKVINRFIPYGVPMEGVPRTKFDDPTLELIYVGRLVEKQKRITEVVKAFCRATDELEQVSAVIYGNGDGDKVLNLINKHSQKKKVKFGGAIANDKIFYTLAKSQVFVLLSDYEGLPQTLLEAMSCGLVPVCLHMKSGIPELIEDGNTGIIVGDRKKSFIAAIKQLEQDRKLCQRISEQAREKIAQSYSIQRSMQEWARLLNDLICDQKNVRKIEIPEEFKLPKPHPYLKKHDHRRQTKMQSAFLYIKESNLIRKIRRLIKKVVNR